MKPIKNVEEPTIANVQINVILRPTLSPKWPKTMPPSGRDRKPTPKVANAAIKPIKGSLSGKNRGAKTSPAAVPKIKKSYHSINAPAKLPMTTRLMALPDSSFPGTCSISAIIFLSGSARNLRNKITKKAADLYEKARRHVATRLLVIYPAQPVPQRLQRQRLHQVVPT